MCFAVHSEMMAICRLTADIRAVRHDEEVGWTVEYTATGRRALDGPQPAASTRYDVTAQW